MQGHDLQHCDCFNAVRGEVTVALTTIDTKIIRCGER